MPKTFFYKLFGAGKMPDEFKNDLQYFEEGVKTTITYRNYRAPGKYFGLKKRWYSGAFGYSQKRIIGIISKNKFIDVSFDSELYNNLKINITEKYVSVTFNSNDFNKNTSGEIEVKFYVDFFDRYKKLALK